MRLLERGYAPDTLDGTSSWQTLSADVDCKPLGRFAIGECKIVIGDTSYSVRIMSDDVKLIEETVRYHTTNNGFLPEASREAQESLVVFYSTTHDLEIEDTRLVMGNNPYVAGMTDDGSYVLATGKPSVGTLKSICFGAASTLACRGSDYVPLHASIGTIDGKNAFAVSGRGNWGKTTNMLSAKIAEPDIEVITDDWSIVATTTGRIIPIDMLVAIRSEAAPGIAAATAPIPAPDYLKDARKDSGRLFSVVDIFGEREQQEDIRLRRVLLTDKRPENRDRIDVYSPDGLEVTWRLKDDAYHSPDIEHAYDAKYERLAASVDVRAINTTLPHELRPGQLRNILNFFRET